MVKKQNTALQNRFDEAGATYTHFSTSRDIPDKAKELLALGWETFAVEGPCMWFRRQAVST